MPRTSCDVIQTKGKDFVKDVMRRSTDKGKDFVKDVMRRCTDQREALFQGLPVTLYRPVRRTLPRTSCDDLQTKGKDFVNDVL